MADASCLEPYIRHEDPVEVLKLNSVIAEGSFGTVYTGCYKPENKTLAIKIIQLEEDETFEDLKIELYVMSKCHSPNIVAFFGSWRKDDELFIGMELCDGGSVCDIYQELNETLSEPIIALIVRETLQGLAYMHNLGIIHRDVKGANILLTRAGAVKLVDFGVSGTISATTPTRETFIGTPYWMAPEVIENRGPPTPYGTAADIWSLGITMLEMAHREPPLSDMPQMKALLQIPYRKSPTLNKPSLWSPLFPEIIAKCLEREQKNRPTCTQLLKHPFINTCAPVEALVQLIARYLESKKATDAAEAAEAEVSEIVPPFPMAEGISKDVDMKRGASAPVPSLPPQPQLPSSPQPAAAASATSVALSPKQPRLQRPRTVHPTAAKRDLADLQLRNRKFVRLQLQEIKKMQRVHLKDRENLEARINNDKQKLARVYANKQQQDQRRFSQEEEQFQRNLQAEKERDTRRYNADADNVKRQQQTTFRAWQKDMTAYQEAQRTEFTGVLSAKEKDRQRAAKEEAKQLPKPKTSISKKMRKHTALQLKVSLIQRRTEQNLWFQQQQDMAKRFDEHCLLLRHKDEAIEFLLDQQASKQAQAMQAMLQMHNRQLQRMTEEHAIQSEGLSKTQELEQENLEQLHTLLRQQIQELHTLERQQSKAHQEKEFNDLSKEQKAGARRSQKEFVEGLKKQLQSLDKALRKKLKQDRTQEFQQQQQVQRAEFEANQKMFNEEEDKIVAEHQECALAKLHQELRDEKQALLKRHREAMDKLKRDQTQEKESIIATHCARKLKILREQQVERLQLFTKLTEQRKTQQSSCQQASRTTQQENFKAVLAVVMEHHAQELQLVEAYHAVLNHLFSCITNLPSDIAQLHQEALQVEAKKKRQQEPPACSSAASLQREQEVSVQRIKARHAVELQQLAETQAAEEEALTQVRVRPKNQSHWPNAGMRGDSVTRVTAARNKSDTIAHFRRF
eukprot:TRINITY_DN1528_c0_g2_i3.p1 TRINITY_DN1528_c0_g2~~TRINITY_DN1528_c0_g2_i3.p1  ORF type:complete len:967 (-),score=285.75 TRINITY_DN1528_c0_g2_i3:174-3074(-)